MEKILQIKELERLLNISLTIIINIEGIQIYNNHNSVVVNEEQNIIGLNLTGQQLKDISFLYILKDLEYLNLTNNQINDISILKGLNKITHLYLSGNLILNIEILENLQQLQVLSLGHNEIQNISAIKFLTNLVDLELGMNSILSCNEISNLKRLKRLDLNSNGVSEINFLNHLESLSILNLESNNIADISSLASLVNLTELRLRQNSISEIGPLKKLIRLKILDLSQNYRISETLALHKMIQMTHLDLGANKIKNIDFVVNFKYLQYLNLESNLINNIYPLHGLVLLENLSISANEIYETYPLQFLSNLKILSLGLNPISDILFLKELKDLNHLSIGRNQISDFSSIKYLKKLTSLYLNDCGLSDISFLKGLSKLTKLNLGMNLISDFSVLESLKNLTILDLHSNLITNISFLATLPKLTKLVLWGNKIVNINVIAKLNLLKELDLKHNEIEEIEILSELIELESLDLANNRISTIASVEVFPKIHFLNVSDNAISKIIFKKTIKTLRTLNLSNNNLTDTFFLSKTPNLVSLNLSKNKIRELNSFENLKNIYQIAISNNNVRQVSQFEFILLFSELIIHANDNPCFDNSHIILKEKENHFHTIANELKKLEDQQIKATLPEKIVLLGNHASGKSSLVHYLQNKKLDHKEDSTHILKIENYPLKLDKLPKAIIYDFGGQDFYHGIYKAFLTSEALTLLLWQTTTNSCHFQLDSKNRPNRNFNVDYWIGQKRHNNIYGETILIQSHADDIINSVRKSYLNEYSEIEDEFFISLGNSEDETFNEKLNLSALRYFKDKLDYIIDKKQKQKNQSGKISKPYFIFLQHILTSKKNYKCTTKDELRQYYLLDEKWRYEQDLEQLHRQGLILVHKENIWLSPVELTKYVHTEILKKEYLNDGIIEKSAFEKNYFPQEIIDLLISQKVIFLHDFGFQNNKKQAEYIIPNYLPLLNDSSAELSLMTFGLDNPLFVLKFKKFLPFGIINQLICHFGQLPDQKKFWRDFLIFTIEREVKIMINLDLDNLQVKVYSEFKKSASVDFQNSVEKYLFYCIMAMYWDFKAIPNSLDSFMKNYKKVNNFTKDEIENLDLDYTEDLLRSFYNDDGCRPYDLYISKDDKNFINYRDLCNVDPNENKLKAYQINKENKLKQYKELPFNIYQNFTSRNLRTMKKIFISYSRKDKKFKDDLKTHLKILERYCVAKAWSCEEMKAGEWDEQIQEELIESDIIVYMVSDNFLASNYIMDKEVNVGIELVKNNPNKKIICVLVRECAWDSWQFLADNFTENGSPHPETTLGKYQFIPWHIFNGKSNEEREELIALEQWDRTGYEVRNIAYKQISTKILETLKQLS